MFARLLRTCCEEVGFVAATVGSSHEDVTFSSYGSEPEPKYQLGRQGVGGRSFKSRD